MAAQGQGRHRPAPGSQGRRRSPCTWAPAASPPARATCVAAFMTEMATPASTTVSLHQTGCAGLCEEEPMVTITDADGTMYRYGLLDKDKVHAIVERPSRRRHARRRVPDQDLRASDTTMADVRTHLLICTGGGCIASGALDVSEAVRAELDDARARRRGRGHRDRLPGPVRPGPGRARLPGRRLLPERPGRGRPRDRRGAPAQGARRRAPREPRARHRQDPGRDGRHPVLQPSGEDRAAQLRHHRPAARSTSTSPARATRRWPRCSPR